jgi:hypothetical protein
MRLLMFFSKINKSARLISLLLYLLGDTIYVALSTPFYAKILSAAQITLPAISERFPYALGAYIVMAIGWYTFVLPISYAWKASLGCPWRVGLSIGTLYGLTLIGTFNFTLAAIFPFWIGWVIWRDVIWACSWNTLMIWTYFLVLPYEVKHPL